MKKYLVMLSMYSVLAMANGNTQNEGSGGAASIAAASLLGSMDPQQTRIVSHTPLGLTICKCEQDGWWVVRLKLRSYIYDTVSKKYKLKLWSTLDNFGTSGQAKGNCRDHIKVHPSCRQNSVSKKCK